MVCGTSRVSWPRPAPPASPRAVLVPSNMRNMIRSIICVFLGWSQSSRVAVAVTHSSVTCPRHQDVRASTRHDVLRCRPRCRVLGATGRRRREEKCTNCFLGAWDAPNMIDHLANLASCMAEYRSGSAGSLSRLPQRAHSIQVDRRQGKKKAILPHGCRDSCPRGCSSPGPHAFQSLFPRSPPRSIGHDLSVPISRPLPVELVVLLGGQASSPRAVSTALSGQQSASQRPKIAVWQPLDAQRGC